MPKAMTRRTFLKRSLKLFLTATGLTTGGYFYAGKVEPKLLDTNKYDVSHNTIPNGFEGFKMVQFSDTHLGFQYSLKQLQNLVDKINSITPDTIFFTGDLIDAPDQYKEINNTIRILKNLKAPFGKYAVYGNHDHGGNGSAIYKHIMEEAGFQLLINEAHEIKLVNGERIFIIGIDDAMLGKPNIESAISSVPEEAYKLLLSHAPDLADIAVRYNIQLQLSGHSHGGQFQIPFVGALVKPPFAEKYDEGFYTIRGDSPLTLYVNRGMGTTRLPFRFLSKPELTILSLKKSG